MREILKVLTPEEVKALGPVDWIKVEPTDIHKDDYSEYQYRAFLTKQNK